MSASLGKSAVVILLILAIAGVLYLKSQQRSSTATLPAKPASTPTMRVPEVRQPVSALPVTKAPASSTTAPKPVPTSKPATKPAPAARPIKPAPRSPAPTPVSTIPTRLPRLLELGADRCVPCKMMQPVLAELRQEYAGKLQVDFIDVWKNPDAGKPYGIQAIPTQIFFDADGKELFRHSGFFAKEDILATFYQLGVTL